jgi:hypothetical protein
MRLRIPLVASLCVLALAAGANAVIPAGAPDLPVLGPETPRGHIVTRDEAPRTPSAKIVDGNPSDWIGAPTRLGGTAIYSAGEYVYQDYLTDDHGADDGRDAKRLKTLDPLRQTEPRTYKLDPVAQVVGDEFGVSGPPLISAQPQYGDASVPGGLGHEADLEEARVAADASRLLVLVRTTGMTVTPGTAVLVLVDTEPGGSYPAPGRITTGAEWAFLAAGDRILAATYKGVSVACVGCEAATDATGFVNAIEIGIPRSLIVPAPNVLGIGIATGVVDASGTGLAKTATGNGKADLINVAFRFHEPVRIRMDRDQALALHDGSMDPFLAPVDLAKLAGGATQSFTPAPGYYDRIYVSHSPVNREESSGGEFQGAFQHYGVYIPTSYPHLDGTPSPATVWLHPRSDGNAHLAAAWVPGIIRQLGEQRGNIIISPSARGSSTWWTGRGQEDFLESWDDAMASFSIDPNRVYLAGHSMGGFGSYLVGLLYPDRFAAAFPISGPPTTGGWLGAGKPISPQNDGDVNAELLFHVIENARNLPYIIYQGANDELVFWPGPARMASRFTQLGYRNRFYTFPGQDHYVPLVVDEWGEAVRYLDTFTRNPNPAHVTYRVWPALERAVEHVSTPAGTTLDYAFDGAYWVDDLSVRSGDHANVKTMGTFDAVTSGRGVPKVVTIPEAGVAGVDQPWPYVMAGLNWLQIGTTAPRNDATITLTNIATGTLDLARMFLATSRAITLAVTTDGPATVRLSGTWASAPTVSGAASSSYVAGTLTLTVASGTSHIAVTP